MRSIAASITVSFMYETINGSQDFLAKQDLAPTMQEVLIYTSINMGARDGRGGRVGGEGSGVFICFFSFGKKVKHFDLNDATLQHPF